MCTQTRAIIVRSPLTLEMPFYFQNFRFSLSWNRQLLSLISLPENTFKNESPIDDGLYLRHCIYLVSGRLVITANCFPTALQHDELNTLCLYLPVTKLGCGWVLYTYWVLQLSAEIVHASGYSGHWAEGSLSLSLSILVCFVLLPDHEVEKDPQLVSMVSQKLSIFEPLPYFILMRGVI